jgi:MoaA/NifB/PqqE/SkfB family radical SAM enzyme
MVEFALETGVDSVEFTVIDTIPGETDVLLLSDKERETVTKKCYEIQHKFGKSLSNNGLKLFQFSQFLRRISTDDASSGEYDKDIIDSVPCSIGWVFTRIMADGNVNACLKAHRIPVGNIYKQRFREIWNGTLQKEFRRKTSKPKKDDPFFSFIGNDPNVKVGCYKGCDDLGRNLHNHKILAALPPPAKIALRLTSKAIKNIMISRPIKVKQC